MNEKDGERRKRYEIIRADLINKGYQETELTIGTAMLNAVGLSISACLAIVLYIIYFGIHRNITWFSKFSLEFFFFFIVYVLAVIMHELIHGFVWSLSCADKRESIYLKVVWKYVTPCCVCLEPIPQADYIRGLLMPVAVLGVLPYMVALIIGSDNLMLFALSMIICGGGDLYVVWKMRKIKGALIIDNPVTLDCIGFQQKE